MLLKKFKKRWYLLLIVIFLNILIVTFSMLQPLILKDVINHIKEGTFNLNWLLYSVILIIVFNICSNLLRVVMELFYKYKISEKIIYELKNELYYNIVKMRMDNFNAYSHGELIQITSSDVNYLRRFLNNAFLNVMENFTTIIIIIIIMLFQSWQLTIVSIIVFPIMAYLSYASSNIEKRFNDLDVQESVFDQIVQESIEGTRVIRAFNQRQQQLNKLNQECQKLYDINYDLNKMLAKKWLIQDGLYYFQQTLLILFGVYFVINNVVTVGLFVAFYNYIERLLWPVRDTGRFFLKISQLFVASNRVNDILSKQLEISDSHQLSFEDYDIQFKNVSFNYDQNNTILNNINFEIKSGEKVAIIGKTGSGKSTLISILLRLYDYSGSIKIGGHELKDIPLQQYRNILGSVMQEPLLFTMSIKDNIITNKSEDDFLLEDVLNASAMNSFINKFNKGINTLVGEKGVTLSGGQKQRTALARSLYRKPNILLLDDALSAVDTKTDQAIQQHFKNLNCSLILITHRLSTAAKMDKIYVIDQGEIIACGNHQQLLATCSQYQSLAKLQQMEF